MDPLTLALINGASNVLGRAVTAPPAGPSLSGISGDSFLMPSTGAFSVTTGSGAASATSYAPSATGGTECACGGGGGLSLSPVVILVGALLWVVMNK